MTFVEKILLHSEDQQAFLQALQLADGAHASKPDQTLASLEDADPHYKDKIIVSSPGVAELYKQLLSGSLTITNDAPVSVLAYNSDSERTTLTGSDLVAIMQESGIHALRLETLAQLFPNAHLPGGGPTLSDLAIHTIQTQKYPQGVPLSYAYVDVSGEIIVSHLYNNELEKFAPKFTQYFVPPQYPDPSTIAPQCTSAQTAFTYTSLAPNAEGKQVYEDCFPDSWPIDLATMTSYSAFELRTNYDDLTEYQKRIFRALYEVAHDPASNTSDVLTVESSDETKLINIQIDFREDPLAMISAWQSGITLPTKHEKAYLILSALNTKLPDLALNPASDEQMSTWLGRPINPEKRNEDLTTVLFYLLDHHHAQRTYGFHDDTQYPRLGENVRDPVSLAAYWNKLAGQPTMHLSARISPQDLESVYFRADHIETASYMPMGKVLNNGVYTREEFAPQHEGESEPLFARYSLNPLSPDINLQEIYFGNHQSTLVYTKEDYLSGPEKLGLGSTQAEGIFSGGERISLSRSYNSGGSLPAPSADHNESGPTMLGGGRNASFLWTTTLLGWFPFWEASPGTADTTHAATFSPEGSNDGHPTYNVVIEGRDGFLPFQGLLQNGGTGSALTNHSGYSDIRGHAIGINNHDRSLVSVYDFTTEQRDVFYKNNLQGHVWKFGVQETVSLNNNPQGTLELKIDPDAGTTYGIAGHWGYNLGIVTNLPYFTATETQAPKLGVYYPLIDGQAFYGYPPVEQVLDIEAGFRSKSDSLLPAPYARFTVGGQAQICGYEFEAGVGIFVDSEYTHYVQPTASLRISKIVSNP